jgi:hypothetical protein
MRQYLYRTKLLAALAGVCAVVILGALLVGQQRLSTTTFGAASSNSHANVPSSMTTMPNGPAIPMAVPSIKGPAPLPLEEQSPAAP